MLKAILYKCKCCQGLCSSCILLALAQLGEDPTWGFCESHPPTCRIGLGFQCTGYLKTLGSNQHLAESCTVWSYSASCHVVALQHPLLTCRIEHVVGDRIRTAYNQQPTRIDSYCKSHRHEDCILYPCDIT